MATITITPGNSFNPTETVTSTKLNDLGSPTAALTAASIGTSDIADDAITPAKLSTGAPEWEATGAFLTNNVTAKEADQSLVLRSDPETPGGGSDGGSQIRLFSSDSDFPDQVFHRADFHLFNNIAGDVQGSIPYGATPSQPQHFVRKDYVDGTSSFTTEDSQSAGYQVFPSGLKMAWGEASDSVTSPDDVVTFPTGVNFTVAPTVTISANTIVSSGTAYYAPGVRNVTTTQFQFAGTPYASNGYRYMAIGH